MARVSSGFSLLMALVAASWMRLSRLMPVPSSSYMEPLTSSTRARFSPTLPPPPSPVGDQLQQCITGCGLALHRNTGHGASCVQCESWPASVETSSGSRAGGADGRAAHRPSPGFVCPLFAPECGGGTIIREGQEVALGSLPETGARVPPG